MATSNHSRYRYQFKRSYRDHDLDKLCYPTGEIDNKEENKKSDVIYMQNVDPGLVGCKGDCGSKLSKILNSLLNNKVM